MLGEPQELRVVRLGCLPILALDTELEEQMGSDFLRHRHSCLS